MTKRHFVIPDLQVRPGVRTDHIEWIAKAIVDYLPDVVVNIGDHWDMPSLSSHEDPGSEFMEGRRYKDDIDSGNNAFERLCAPMDEEISRRKRRKIKRWEPRKIFTFGNHEDRISRFASANPRFRHIVNIDDCNTQDFERHRFGDITEADGVLYSHYFSSPHSGRAIGGTPQNRLNKVCQSFVMGHVQGFDYGTKITPTGKTMHGVVAGSAYTHLEGYRGVHQKHWRGCLVLNEVSDGDFCIMPITLNYLCRKYEGKPLFDYMTAKYPEENWSHLKE